MKKMFLCLSKVMVCCSTVLLFSCEDTDSLDFDCASSLQEVVVQDNEDSRVTSEKAIKIANSFFSKEYNAQTRSENGYTIETIGESSSPAMYIINYSNGGFIIIGGTQNYYPILAYSNNNSFDSRTEISGVSRWLEETQKAIKESSGLNDSIKAEMKRLWNRYEAQNDFSDNRQSRSTPTNAQIACWNRCDELQMQYGGQGWQFAPLSQMQSVFSDAGFPTMYDDLCYSANFNNSPIEASVVGWKDGSERRQVGPLFSTEWGQNSPYNDLCDGKPAGCAAVAVAQLMKYYQYPQSFNLNGYYFNWSNILDTPSANSDHAALIRLVGIALNTHYSSSGSWVTPGSLKEGLEILGYNVTDSDHNYEKVESELFQNKPVIMLGSDDNIPLPSPLNYIGKSHYWVCEGALRRITNRLLFFTEWQPNGNGTFSTGWYRIDNPGILGGVHYLQFYMNWGWCGYCDGWYAFNNVHTDNGDYEHARKDFYITKP